MHISVLPSKIASFCKREVRKKSNIGIVIFLLYRLMSGQLVQFLLNAFFTFYASAYAMKNHALNWEGIIIYFIILSAIGMINRHRSKQYKRVDLLKNVLEQYVTVVDLADNDLVDILISEEDVNILDNASQAIVSSVYDALQEYYNEREFKVSIVQNFSDTKGPYCKMTSYNKLSAIPERHRTKYYHADINSGQAKNFPFFARVLAGVHTDEKYIGRRGEIYIKKREEIKSLFEDNQHRNGTQQYLGFLIYSEEKDPVMLLQVCANFNDGFGDINDVDIVLNTILVPYAKQLCFAYDIQRFYEQKTTTGRAEV